MSAFSAGRQELMELFRRLSRAHGPSGWWPSQYGGNFEIVCGAILTQRVAWRNVEEALRRMRAANLWDWAALRAAPDEALQRAIRPSGFYRSKARKLKAFAEVVLARHGGRLERMLAQEADALRQELLGIWGIGDETADDIVLYAAGHPRFVIDAYTMRIVERLGWEREAGGAGRARYAKYQRFFEGALERDAALFQEFHGLLDLHAARVCRARPRCGACCLSDICASSLADEKGRRRGKNES